MNYKPSDTQSVIPYLLVPDAERELAFVKEVFGAKEMHVFRDPGGCVVHAQVAIGDSRVMLAQANEQWPALPATIYIYVPDVDAAYGRALARGAVSLMQPEDKYWGDRNGGAKDSNGVQWWMATHIEDVPSEELARRAGETSKKRAHA